MPNEIDMDAMMPVIAEEPRQITSEDLAGLDEGSPTLRRLEPSRRPPHEVVCATCPQAMWHVNHSEVRSYCRVMFMISWSSQDQNGFVKACDGPSLK